MAIEGIDPVVLFLAVQLVVFISTVVRAATGFGSALVSMPSMVLLLGLDTAAPLVAWFSGFIGLLV